MVFNTVNWVKTFQPITINFSIIVCVRLTMCMEWYGIVWYGMDSLNVHVRGRVVKLAQQQADPAVRAAALLQRGAWKTKPLPKG